METTTDTPTPNSAPNKSPLWFRIAIRFSLVVITLILLCVGAAFVVGYYYQDEVKEYVVGELNKQLKTEILIDGKDIDFTIIKSFPLASLNFRNAKALDATENKHKDTLFNASLISLQFNLYDIIKKNYNVKKIEIDNATIKIRIDKNGNDNYHFWKSSNDSATTNFKIALDVIELKECRLLYSNKKAKQRVDLKINKSKLSGEFSNSQYSLKTTSDIWVANFKSDSTVFLKNKNIHAEVALTVDNTMPSYKIQTAKLKTEDVQLDVVGNVLRANNETIVNLIFKGKDLNIKSFLSLIPANYKHKIEEYKSDGEFYFNATMQGSYSFTQTPVITADFGIMNANITQVKDNRILHQLNLKGNYTSGDKTKQQPSRLILKSISATIEQSNLQGELIITNLKNPSFEGKLSASMNMNDVQRFLKLDTVEQLSGRLNADVNFSARSKANVADGYDNIIASGNLNINNVTLKIKNDNMEFKNIDGAFRFDNNNLEITEIKGEAGTSDFDLKGTMRNLINFIIKPNEDVLIEASLTSKLINLNELLANKAEESNDKSKYKLRFSEHINLNLTSEIAHLTFRKFDATEIKGTVTLRNKKMVLDPITLNTMNGSISTSGMIDGTDSTKLLVTCFSDVFRINISKMFDAFENFGQKNITDKNVKGIATAKIQFASELTPELKMDMTKLYSGIDMTVENGELNNVDAMKSLSRFIALSELENIRFATLHNLIEIKNQQIFFPKMEVKSSAINVTASGTHSFKNEINYKIKLSLNELLSKKAKSAKKENNEFGEIEDDGLGRTNIFLLMTGTVDKPIIKYDTHSAIQNVKQELKVEKQTLKAILKEEFGLFKKDSSLNKKANKAEETKFKIQWDEADKKEEKKELKRPKKEEEDF